MARVSNIDDDLLERAERAAGHNGDAYAINKALKVFLEEHQKNVEAFLALKGTVEFDEDWSPRKARGKQEDGTWNG
jgi:Arc/MetJ family transcription regulator